MSSHTSIALAIGTIALAWPAAARAQHCHLDSAPATARPAAAALELTVGTRWTAGAAEVAMRDVAYQGGELTVDARWRRLAAGARLGAYHVDQHGVGLGDLGVAGALTLTPAAAPIAVQALAGATFPTGDADAGRGMGHVMMAAGAGARAAHGRVAADLALTYARALGDGAEHAAHLHGAEAWPLIDPMGASEVTAEAGVAVGVGGGVALRGALLGAEPLGHGERRLIASGGVAVARDRYLVTATVAAPTIGAAFIARGQVAVAYRY